MMRARLLQVTTALMLLGSVSVVVSPSARSGRLATSGASAQSASASTTATAASLALAFAFAFGRRLCLRLRLCLCRGCSR